MEECLTIEERDEIRTAAFN